jgi:ABC-type transport system substrate-binding protein
MMRSHIRSVWSTHPLKTYLVIVLTLACLLVSGTALWSTGCGSGGTGTSASTSGGGGTNIQPGGILRVATEPATNRDPAFASARADILINQQVYDWLVNVGQKNELLAGLASAWESPDGKVWTFTLRADVKFSNGTPFTADDVVYTFNRLRDPKVGSPA